MHRIILVTVLAVAGISAAEIDVENSDADAFVLSGNLYARYSVFGQRNIIPDESWSIRRAGLTAEVRLGNNLEAEIQLETRPDEIYLKDCFLCWNPINWAEIKAGQFKKPFCLNSMTNSWNLMTLDHALAHWTATDLRYSGRDIGLELEFTLPAGYLPVISLGIFNGVGFRETKENNEKLYVARCLFNLPYGIGIGGGLSALRLGESNPEAPSGYTCSPRQQCIGADISFEQEVIDDLEIRAASEYITGANWLLADVIAGEDAPDFRSIWASLGGMLRTRNVPGIRSLEACISFEVNTPDTNLDTRENILSPVLGVWFSRTTRLRFGAQCHSFHQTFNTENYTDYIVEAAVNF